MSAGDARALVAGLARLPAHGRKWIGDHWAGRHGLALCVLVSLIGVRLLLGQLQALIPRALLAIWLLLSALILVWQVVGGWRACERTIRAGGGMGLVWLGYFCLCCTVVLALLQSVDAVASFFLRPVAVSAPPPLPRSQEGDVVYLQGALDWPMHTALEVALQGEGGEDVRTIVLHSDGGLVFAARGLALLIAKHGIATHVDHTCFSACTIVFLAGRERTLGTHGQLGFHRYHIDEPNKLATIDVATELQKDREYFASRGVGAAFIRLVFQAAFTGLWKPDRQMLLRARVLTRD